MGKRKKETRRLPWYLEEPGFHNYIKAPMVTLDLETTNLDKGDPRTAGNRHVLGVVDGEVLRGMDLENRLATLSQEPMVLAAHNAKFELGWLIRMGIDLDNILVWDTMIGEYVLAGNRQWPLDLDSVAKRYGVEGKERTVDALMKGGVCPSEIPEKWLEDRCLADVRATRAIAEAQMESFRDTALGQVFFTRCIVTPVLASIEAEGMTLDQERVEEEYLRCVEEQHALTGELVELYGAVNFRSGKQVAELLYDKLGFPELTNKRGEPRRTATGARMTDAATLLALKAKTKAQRKFLDLRGRYGQVNARLTKSLEFFKGVCDNYGGTFYGNFNQCVTQTHRLSSSGRKEDINGEKKGVQFQNLPREYKRLFRSKVRGWKVVEIDGAQLEFRVAGILGGDLQVCRDVLTDADIHRYTASVLFKRPEAEITKEQRTAAKAETFAPLYGANSGDAKRKAYIEAFHEKYNEVYKTQQGWVQEVLREGKLVTPWGLVFYWPGTKVERDGYIANSTSIFNYPIQSFATADIIPVSMVYLFWRIKEKGVRARIVNTVHDSTPTEVHPEDVDKLREVAISSFLEDTYKYILNVYGIEIRIPLGIGFTVGEHWGEGEEEKISQPFLGTLLEEEPWNS